MSEPKPLAEFHGKGITDELERRVAALEAALAKQRAVNVALEKQLLAISLKDEKNADDDLLAAISEALK